MSNKGYYPEYSPFVSRCELIDHDDFLGLAWGWEIGNDQPVYERWISVSKLRLDRDSYLRSLVGKEIRDFSGNIGRVDAGYQWQYIDTNTWEQIKETKPIEKRRNGKDWEWRWTPNFMGDSGRYVKHYLRSY